MTSLRGEVKEAGDHPYGSVCVLQRCNDLRPPANCEARQIVPGAAAVACRNCSLS